MFAFLFGISMDYQVFIISRMREAYDRTGSTETAVIEGIGRTGRLVTSAALILFLAFVAFSLQPGTEAKIFATALGGGILIDATIVRGVLTPAAVALLGRWNWWMPNWAARILRRRTLARPAQARLSTRPSAGVARKGHFGVRHRRRPERPQGAICRRFAKTRHESSACGVDVRPATNSPATPRRFLPEQEARATRRSSREAVRGEGMERAGIEPATSALQRRRSPS